MNNLIKSKKQEYENKMNSYDKEVKDYLNNYGMDNSDYLIHRRIMSNYYRGAYNAMIELEKEIEEE